MGIKIQQKQKTRTVAFRIPETDFLLMEKIAKRNKVPLAFACWTVFNEALKVVNREEQIIKH